MAAGALLRRLGAEPVATAAGIITTVTALTLLAAGPIYADAVSQAALRQKLQIAEDAASSVQVSMSIPAADSDEVDAIVRSALDTALGSVATTSRQRLASRSFGFDGRVVSDDRTDLAQFYYVQEIEEHATMVAGEWPQSGSSMAEVAVDDRAAGSLGIIAGDRTTMTARGRDPYSVEVRISGVFTIADTTDPFWLGQPQLREGVTISPQFRTIAMATDHGSFLELAPGQVDGRWTGWPDFDRLDLDNVEALSRRSASLGRTLESNLEQTFGAGPNGLSDIVVETELPRLLEGTTRSIEVTRSSVLAVMLQLGLLGAYSLVHLSGWLVTTREPQSALLRARGASPAQVARPALAESLSYVVPSFLMAPIVAAWAVARLDSVGPLATIGLVLEPSPSGRAYGAAAVAAVGTTMLLVVPVYRAARGHDRASSRRRRQRSRSMSQRLGADVVLVVLAAIVLWQLKSLDANRTGIFGGRFGVDPMLVLAPVVTMAAGAVLALRVVPALVRVAQRFTVSGRSAVGALVSWQLARRPKAFSRSSLLLVLAVSISVFAAGYEATWQRSQRDQATQQVGAEVYLSPNRRVDDSLTDLYLSTAHERLDDVGASVPSQRRQGTVGNGSDSTDFVLIDAARALHVIQLPSTAEIRLRSALGALAAARPTIGSLELPGRPTSFSIDVAVISEGVISEPSEPSEPGFEASVLAVVQDGNDLLYRLRMGGVEAMAGPTTLTAGLVSSGPDGTRFEPEYPIAIVALEIRSPFPSAPRPELILEVTDLRVSTDTARTERLAIDWSRQAWRASLHTDAGGFEHPTIQDAEAQPDTGRRLLFEPGWSQTPGLSIVQLRVTGPQPTRSLPVLVTDAWLEATDRVIGDQFDLPVLLQPGVRAEVVAAIPGFPTVDPADADVMVFDLATVQMHEFVPGRPIRVATEYWLSLDDASEPVNIVRQRLVDPPYESVEVLFRSGRLDELRTDPSALGLIGALAIGALAAAVFAVVGILVSFSMSVRERAREFALVEALGLSPNGIARWILIERALLVAVSVVIGTALGAVICRLVLPLIALTQAGDAVNPTPVVVVPLATILSIDLFIVGALATGAGMMSTRHRRSLAAQLRIGEDQ